MVTSAIAPDGPVTASSFGMTKPVYDGSFRWSTRATTSSRSAGSKCTPCVSNKLLRGRVIALRLDPLHFREQPARPVAELLRVRHDVVGLAVPRRTSIAFVFAISQRTIIWRLRM